MQIRVFSIQVDPKTSEWISEDASNDEDEKTFFIAWTKRSFYYNNIGIIKLKMIK